MIMASGGGLAIIIIMSYDIEVMSYMTFGGLALAAAGGQSVLVLSRPPTSAQSALSQSIPR